MSQFENAYDAWWNVTYGNKGLSAALHKAFEHVLARLSDLEAAQKKLELQPVSIRDVLSHEPKGRFELRFDGTIGWRKDAPDKPREPGLYSVDWGENSQDWPLAFYSDGTWYKIYFTTIGAATPRVIGPRITEPGE